MAKRRSSTTAGGSLALAVLAYDRALQDAVKAGLGAGTYADMQSRRAVQGKDLDTLYLDMLQAAAPLLVKLGRPIPKNWPIEEK